MSTSRPTTRRPAGARLGAEPDARGSERRRGVRHELEDPPEVAKPDGGVDPLGRGGGLQACRRAAAVGGVVERQRGPGDIAGDAREEEVEGGKSAPSSRPGGAPNRSWQRTYAAQSGGARSSSKAATEVPWSDMPIAPGAPLGKRKGERQADDVALEREKLERFRSPTVRWASKRRAAVGIASRPDAWWGRTRTRVLPRGIRYTAPLRRGAARYGAGETGRGSPCAPVTR